AALYNAIANRGGLRAQAANQVTETAISKQENEDRRRADLMKEVDDSRKRMMRERDGCYEEKRVVANALHKLLLFLEDDFIPELAELGVPLKLRVAIRTAIDRARTVL